MKKFDLDFGSVWILDNFLEPQLLQGLAPQVEALPFSYIEYAYRDHPAKEFSTDMQHAYLVNGSPIEKVLDIPRIEKRIFTAFESEELLRNRMISRVHISKVTSTDPRHFHIDSADTDLYVAVMFLNHKWSEEWDGDLVLKNGEEEIRVNPIPGRLVIFNGRIVHRGGLVATALQDKYTLVCKLVRKETSTKAA